MKVFKLFLFTFFFLAWLQMTVLVVVTLLEREFLDAAGCFLISLWCSWAAHKAGPWHKTENLV